MEQDETRFTNPAPVPVYVNGIKKKFYSRPFIFLG